MKGFGTMENMLALMPGDALVKTVIDNVGWVLTSQFLGLAISPVALDGGKVEIAFSASDWSAVHAHGQVGPDSLVNTLSLCCQGSQGSTTSFQSLFS